MATIKKIGTLTFARGREPELMAKLNAVAPYLCRNVHNLAKYALLLFLDKQIQKHKIEVDYPKVTQSARAG